jgi:hypothetical protein
MKRLLRPVGALLSSRITSPVIIGIFLLVYIGTAFFTEDALIALMEFTRKNGVLLVLLTLLPLNVAGRMVVETRRFLQKRRSISSDAAVSEPELFDETIDLAASSTFAELQGKLDTLGYSTRRTEKSLSAWKGASIFPARMLFLVAVFCLFTGILISLTNRSSHRVNVIEGEPIPTANGGGGLVERISLKLSTGAILDKNLTMEVAPSAAGEGRKVFGIYPPSLYRGYFVYPRYLGFASVIRFSAPDMQSANEKISTLNIYPPGKEDRLEITGTPYQIILSMAKPDNGSSIPYMEEPITLLFKVLKGKDPLFTGSAPVGGEFVRDGFRLAIPDFRRMVITDFIQDYGVYFIWTAIILFFVAVCLWLPIRAFFPRREILFIRQEADDGIRAYSRAEGYESKHSGVFNEALDMLNYEGIKT